MFLSVSEKAGFGFVGILPLSWITTELCEGVIQLFPRLNDGELDCQDLTPFFWGD